MERGGLLLHKTLVFNWTFGYIAPVSLPVGQAKKYSCLSDIYGAQLVSSNFSSCDSIAEICELSAQRSTVFNTSTPSVMKIPMHLFRVSLCC
ncbi:hypothetical protein PILCRDRAFT_329528 [Piloderma croceum F 1598]|uniref:Uncharacterized protein n=1 Tax=Piloderma croceum (strain F 1598) TaxID=765440 RepID=A0A0C3G248_PILCF|nr:hypothetical protein PILCRDRAFT_329528 [Piloderma croceum F 1598]